jgi:hypothetical protein
MVNRRNFHARIAFLFVVFVFTAVACSSAKKTPDVDSNDLVTPKFEAINPKNIHLIISNHRQINQDAGNSVEVEQSLYKTVAEALNKGGFVVKNTSKNQLELVISDYPGANPMGECVKINALLRARWGNAVTAEAYGCHELKHFTGIKLGGNVSEAYRFALNAVLQELNEEQMGLAGY